MKKLINISKFSSILILIIVFLTAAWIQLSTAKSPSAIPSSDPNIEYSDPAYKMSMPKEWIDKPIKYEKWAEGADIALVLDQHIYIALLPIIQEYAKNNNLKIEVREGTCGIAAGALNKKTVDIVGLCCPPAKFDRLPGLKYQTLGIAALAVLINEQNPIDNVTTEQVRGLFSGKILKWSQLKDKKWNLNADADVHPITRLHCKTRPGHWRLILPSEDFFPINMKDVGTIPDMVSSVSQDKYSIGFESVWPARYYINNGRVKILSINGYNPESGTENLISSNYPFYEPYHLTIWEGKAERNIKAQRLVEYLITSTDKISKKFLILPVKDLKKAGWRFEGDELLGAK